MSSAGFSIASHTGFWLAAELSTVDSTNSHLYAWARREALAEGAVVVAQGQTAGRGRRERSWVSPEGGLYLSLLLRPPIAAARAPELTQLTALALHRAVAREIGDGELALKWPNDLLYQGRKVAGVLCELSTSGSELDFVVVGIGVNCRESVLPLELEAIATTLPLDRRTVSSRLLEELGALYGAYQRDGAAVLSGYPRVLRLVGRRVRIEDGPERHEGRVLRLGPSGTLILELDDGNEREFCTGDVTQLDGNGEG